MRLHEILLTAFFLFFASSSTAGSSQFGLPGYIPDPEPITQTTPQLVFASLQDAQGARAKLTREPGVFLVDVPGNPTPTSYIFFGKGHWAYPSVLRFRRSQTHSVWATHISIVCNADVRICGKLTKKVGARSPQVVNAPFSVLEDDEIKRLKQPLPDGISPPGKDFLISQWELAPDTREYAWQMSESDKLPSDPNCGATHARYGIPPAYPMMEAIDGIGGPSVMIMTIDRTGRVIDAKIERSSGNRNLDISAISSASVMRFDVKGCNAPNAVTRVRLPVAFTPDTKFPYMKIAEFDASVFGY